MHSQSCLTTKELEAFANGADRSSGLAEHIQDCPICRERSEKLKAEAALIQELQAASHSAVASPVRKRLLAVCRKIAADEARLSERRASAETDAPDFLV